MTEELFTRFGESESCINADRKLIEDLFGNLYNNLIIYNERHTVLSEVFDVEISDDEYTFKHRPIRMLEMMPTVEYLYDQWQSVPHLTAGAGLDPEKFPHVYASGRLSTTYAGNCWWPGAKRVEYVVNMSDDELRTDFGHVMWNRPKLG